MSNYEDEMKKNYDQFKQQFGNPFKIVYPVLIALIVLGGMSSYYTVGPDEEAVVTRFGKYIGTMPPGLHFKIPFGIDRKQIEKTTQVHQEEFGFRTSEIVDTRTSYSRGNFQAESLMLTGDLNVADVEWVVQYRISDLFKYLFKASNPIQNIRDVSESIMRRAVGDQLVNKVLTTGRATIAGDVKILMQEVIDKYDIGVHITAVKLQDVNPPRSVKASFNEVNEAKQEQEKLINQAEEAYNRVIPEARGKAEKQIEDSKGFAGALVDRAQGDAQKFTLILKEYKRAPKITKTRLYIDAMEVVYSRLKKLTIVDKGVKGLLPIFNKKAE
jgi:membrane protease subunit HflK